MKRLLWNGCLCLLAGTLLTIPSQAQKKSTDRWMESRVWQDGASAKPSSDIDTRELMKHYRKYPQRWQVVFDFIKSHDMTTLPVGKTKLSDDVTLNVQKYETNTPPAEVRYEKHIKMIDVQYVISGRELQGAIKIGRAKEVVPYNAEKDVAFYVADNVPYQVISAGEYTVFFPDDTHLTGIGFGEKTAVYKAVFKIKY